MTYAEVLPLATIKNYLRIEPDVTEDDRDLERMAAAALQFIERRTNHIFSTRYDVVYGNDSGRTVDIYDYPLVYEGQVSFQNLPGKTRFNAGTVTVAQVGYQFPEDVPDALKEAALQIIETWYYNADKQTNQSVISDSVKQLLAAYRRFTI